MILSRHLQSNLHLFPVYGVPNLIQLTLVMCIVVKLGFSISWQVNSLLALRGAQLKNLFCDPKGAHVADVFLKSASVGEKSRDALVRQLQASLYFNYFPAATGCTTPCRTSHSKSCAATSGKV